MGRIIRTEKMKIEVLKTLVPKLLLGCKEYLNDYGIDDTLTYDKIHLFYPEHRGNIDECGGHYQMDTRITDNIIPAGKINFFYDEMADEALNIHVTDQGSGSINPKYLDTVDEITDHIKCLLDNEEITYEVDPVVQ
ncbi:MAG: hypothetical protein KAS90_02540 [Candidatus Aenigmarchaeota archaeon]|nr:hypothetical protein [Candidatus Aenigmarchaeota archaeon]